MNPCNRDIFIPIGPSIAYVPLTQGQHALIDAEDAEHLGKFNWCALYNKGAQQFYVWRGLRKFEGKGLQGIHREILKPPKHLSVDHINRNPLDNRKTNLRVANACQQNGNKGTNKNNTSGYRGAYLQKTSGKWFASIEYGGKPIHLGTFSTAKEAGNAYSAKAQEIFGVFYNDVHSKSPLQRH